MSAKRRGSLLVLLALSMTMPGGGCGSSSQVETGTSGATQTGAGGAGTGTGGTGGSGSDGGTVDAGVIRVEIGTWWSGVSETKALQAVLELHKKSHPDVQVELATVANASQLFTLMQTRFIDGNPLGLFQAPLGVEAQAWGPSLRSIGASAAAWSQAFPASVLAQVMYEGSLRGVPLALSRQNMAYWNLKVLDSLTLAKKIPETPAELDTWLREVSALGYSHPLCFGGKDAWTAAWFLFNHVVPAVAGPDFSVAYWRGNVTSNDPKLVAAVEAAKAFVPYLTPDFLDLDMLAGITKLMIAESDKARQCLVTPTGDWGGAILADVGHVPNRDFAGTGWPGSELVTVFGGDGFLSAIGAANVAAIDALIDTMASEAGQLAFSLAKGSIPARRLAQVPASFDALTQANIADLSNPAGTVVPGYLSMAKSAFPRDPLSTVTQEFFVTKDATALLTFLKDNYAQLK